MPGNELRRAPANSNADLTILGDPVRMASGVNTIDTITGYLGNTNGNASDTNAAVVTQEEFITVPGSLLNKALVAQTVFNNKFLLPFAPDRPEFFLVPGNAQVTVLWTRSPTETIRRSLLRRLQLADDRRRAESAVRSELPPA